MKTKFIPAPPDTFWVRVYEDQAVFIETLIGYHMVFLGGDESPADVDQDEHDVHRLYYVTASEAGTSRYCGLSDDESIRGIMHPSGRVSSVCHLSADLNAFRVWALLELKDRREAKDLAYRHTDSKQTFVVCTGNPH